MGHRYSWAAWWSGGGAPRGTVLKAPFREAPCLREVPYLREASCFRGVPCFREVRCFRETPCFREMPCFREVPCEGRRPETPGDVRREGPGVTRGGEEEEER
ncbi:hypothetical protein GCM10022252_67050 [Streptosporangium oxazolinicum]|uniref:Uncharacterized protein n=1 Tax=Streptosporangium oxazolinicum TaxID=909287 RepID=A0ABP8BFV7_9ACTN